MMDHLVRRAASSAPAFVKRTLNEGSQLKIPTWGAVVLISTFLVSALFMSLVEYTLKNVVATLAMVETPSAAITVSPSDESAPKDVKEGLLESGPTITLVHQKPITSSIRGTIHHIVAQAGKWSRFRGVKSMFLYNLCFSIAVQTLMGVFPRGVFGRHSRMVIVSGLAGALCANLHATWTHKVVSMPSSKSFWSRVVPRSSWKVLAFPAAAESSAKYLSMYIAHGFCAIMGMPGLRNRKLDENLAAYSAGQWALLALRFAALGVVVLSCILFIVIPARVTLTRIEASLLPEDEDTIVPFDRSFDGKVVPKVLGGTGAIGFLDAWRSFNWEARRRLIKLYIKTFAIMAAMVLAVAHVFALEIWAIMGPQLGLLLAQARRDGLAQ